VARWIVAGKLQNCRRMISRWLWDADGAARWVLASERDAIADRLQALAQATDGHTIRGIEGDGTRRYFKCREPTSPRRGRSSASRLEPGAHRATRSTPC